MNADRDQERMIEDATRSIDDLIEASSEVEKTLESAGVAHAHELMFAVREILYDMRRLHAALAHAFAAEPGEPAAHALDRFATMFQFEVIPHVQAHLDDLRRDLGLEEDEGSA
jgi:hypothetical protein